MFTIIVNKYIMFDTGILYRFGKESSLSSLFPDYS